MTIMEEKNNIIDVTVLMSTYNGEKFLKEQLNSIFNQTGLRIHLIVRDDCSTDSTVKILKEYQSKHDGMQIIEGKKNLKPCASFFELICNNIESDYFALSDQDDVWDPNKLICAISKLDKLDNSKPALYFSNLKIVDENNKIFRNLHSVPKNVNNRYESLVLPAATGCTMVYNKKLAEIARSIRPKKFSMHDTWLYMVAMFFGNVVYDFMPHINYRQHGDNVIGTSLNGKNNNMIWREIERFFNRNLQPRYDNAVEFLREFGQYLNKDDLNKVMEIVNYKRTFRERMILLKDNDFYVEDRKTRIQNKVLIIAGLF